MADQVRVNLPDLAERYLAYSGQLREMAFADFFFCMIYSKKIGNNPVRKSVYWRWTLGWRAAKLDLAHLAEEESENNSFLLTAVMSVAWPLHNGGHAQTKPWENFHFSM